VKGAQLLYSGKAKSIYRGETPNRLIMEFRDDITAFDGTKKNVLSEKGAFNCCVSAFLFELLEREGIRTHYLGRLDRTTMLVKALTMIPLEVVVRNRAAGSIVRNFSFTEGQILNPPVIVIDLKDDSRHDPMLNDDLILALKLVTPDELVELKEIALAINGTLSEFLDGQGILLVDLKLEFGRAEGEITLGDEISMDSMRLWDKETGRSMDKDVYRFDKGDVVGTYRAVARRITGGRCEV